VEKLGFAQQQIDVLVELLYQGGVELRNVSRVNIANASDEAIMKLGSAD